MGKDYNFAPMQRISDGTNDITFVSEDKSKLQLAKVLIAQDNGEYFFGATHERKGEINPNVGIDYFKTVSWSIEPNRKGPVPEEESYQLPEGTETFINEIFSIDGERYPA